MIKNILFDLDDTLLDFRLAERIALTKTLKHMGIEPRDEILARYSELNSSQWKLLEQGLLTRSEVKIRRYELLFDEIGANSDPVAATAYYENLLGVGHYFIDGAEELLKLLCKDYALYIVSNGTAPVQKSRIESAKIGRYFKGIFISQLIGFDKPSIDFFNYCFSKIPKFREDETVIVGDSLTSDIKGGINARIRSVWFNPRGVENTIDILPDYEINKLADLVPLINNI